MYYVYLLKSKIKDQTYVGSTNNLRRRFKEHNDGEVLSTKYNKPWSLFYYEAYTTEHPARIREQRLKDGGNAMKELKKRIGEGLSSTTFGKPKSGGFIPHHFSGKKSGAGFTLVEIMVAIGILAIIFSLGLFVSMSFFKSYTFRSEENVVTTILQSARSQSLNNIDQVRHGVHFQGSPLKYISFECPSGTPQCSTYTAGASDITTTPSHNASITSPAVPFDIIFDQLSGDCVNCSSPVNIQITDGVKNYTITVNSEGQISW